MRLAPYRAKYFAHDLTRRAAGGIDRLSTALFALHSPLSKGDVLADKVGLGKTVETGIVLCQLWAERVIPPLVVGA